MPPLPYILALLLGLVASSTAAGEVPLSNFTCNDESGWTQVCKFHNLTVWRGRLYAVVADPNITLPTPRLNERSFEPKLAEVLKLVTPEQFKAEVLDPASKAGGDSLYYEQAWTFTPWVLSNYYHSADDAAQLFLRFCVHTGRCRYSRAAAASTALLALFSPDRPDEVPLGVRQLYGCYASALFQIEPAHMHKNYYSFQLFDSRATFLNESEDRGVGQPRGEVPLVRLGQVMFGVGMESIPLYVAGGGQEEASEEHKLGRVRFMRECAGLLPRPDSPPREGGEGGSEEEAEDGGEGQQGEQGSSSGGGGGFSLDLMGSVDAAAALGSLGGLPAVLAARGLPRRVRPHVVLVNRALPAGRSILRMDEVYFGLRQRRVSTALVFLEGASLAEQAQVFNSADVLVVPHGAATANFMFLPKHAIIIEVSNLEVHLHHDWAISQQLPKTAYDVTYKSIYSEDVDFSEPIMSKLRHHGGFQSMEPEHKAAMLEKGTYLNHVKGSEFASEGPLNASTYPGLWGTPHDATKFISYNPPPAWVVGNVTQAVEEWRQKAGWAGPSRWGEGLGQGQWGALTRRQLQRSGAGAAAGGLHAQQAEQDQVGAGGGEKRPVHRRHKVEK